MALTVRKVKTIVIAVVALLVLIVILQNTQTATTKILFVTVEMPRVLLLVIMLAVGFIAGLLTPLGLRGKGDKGV